MTSEELQEWIEKYFAVEEALAEIGSETCGGEFDGVSRYNRNSFTVSFWNDLDRSYDSCIVSDAVLLSYLNGEYEGV